MRTAQRKWSRPLALVGVMAAVLVLASTALAAVVSATDSTPGYADASQFTRDVSIADSGVVTDANVSIDFQKDSANDCTAPGTGTAFSDEIAFSLMSPMGTVVHLVYAGDEAGGPTYTNGPVVPRAVVTFDDEAATLVGGGQPTAGTFQPEEPLSAFDGEAAAGTWTLTVRDSVGADYLCYYGFTLELTTDSAGPSSLLCDLADGSLNATHCGRPVAIYAEGDGFSIYGIDINTGEGALASEITGEMIDAAGVPADGPVVIADGQNPYNYQPFTLYRLPTGEFQLNTFYWDGKPYNVKWEGSDPVTALDW